MTPVAVASDELRAALATRNVGRRVTYHARVADRIVRALRHLHPDRGGNVEHAIVELERALPRLPADAAHHVE